MTPLKVSLTQPQLDWLHQRSARTGLPVGELVRRAIDDARGPGEWARTDPQTADNPALAAVRRDAEA